MTHTHSDWGQITHLALFAFLAWFHLQWHQLIVLRTLLCAASVDMASGNSLLNFFHR